MIVRLASLNHNTWQSIAKYRLVGHKPVDHVPPQEIEQRTTVQSHLEAPQFNTNLSALDEKISIIKK